MSIALTILNQMVDEAKRKRYPNVPSHALVESRYSDRTANDLTKAIITFCNLLPGCFATRLSSTGLYRDDIKQYVPNQQRKGLPDIMGVYQGIAFYCEVKIGDDKLSKEQLVTIKALEAAGAQVHVARTFQGFFNWFDKLQASYNNA